MFSRKVSVDCCGEVVVGADLAARLPSLAV
jgi:hypothetical protein